MTMKRKHECNSPDCVSYKQLELSKRIVPTHTKVYKCISHFCQGEFSIIPMVESCPMSLANNISNLNTLWKQSLSWTLTVYEECTRAKFWVCNVYIHQVLSFLKSSEVQGKLPSDFRTNCSGTLFPNSQEEWRVVLPVNIGYFCVPAPHPKMFLRMRCS